MFIRIVVLDMSSASARFWRELDEYHSLAEMFDSNISVVSPPRLTGRSGEISWCGCFRCANVVKYFKYTGPSI